jgi:hypothetical protein
MVTDRARRDDDIDRPAGPTSAACRWRVMIPWNRNASLCRQTSETLALVADLGIVPQFA